MALSNPIGAILNPPNVPAAGAAGPAPGYPYGNSLIPYPQSVVGDGAMGPGAGAGAGPVPVGAVPAGPIGASPAGAVGAVPGPVGAAPAASPEAHFVISSILSALMGHPHGINALLGQFNHAAPQLPAGTYMGPMAAQGLRTSDPNAAAQLWESRHPYAVSHNHVPNWVTHALLAAVQSRLPQQVHPQLQQPAAPHSANQPI